MSEKIKIVMIDDETDLTLMVKANLEDLGDFEVTTLDDPTRAEEVIRQVEPDVILLDVVMPQRNGRDVAEALRKDAELKSIPIVMVSGKGEMVYNKKKDEFKWMPNTRMVQERGDLPEARSAEALAEAYGVDDYVAKPFTTELLLEVIKEVLSRRRKISESPPEDEAE